AHRLEVRVAHLDFQNFALHRSEDPEGDFDGILVAFVCVGLRVEQHDVGGFGDGVSDSDRRVTRDAAVTVRCILTLRVGHYDRVEGDGDRCRSENRAVKNVGRRFAHDDVRAERQLQRVYDAPRQAGTAPGWTNVKILRTLPVQVGRRPN